MSIAATQETTDEARVHHEQLSPGQEPDCEAQSANEKEGTKEQVGPDIAAEGCCSTRTPGRSTKKRRLSQTRNDDNDDFDADFPNASALKRPRIFKVAFHPDAVDNSLWADLNDAKRNGELNMISRQCQALYRPKYKKPALQITSNSSRSSSPAPSIASSHDPEASSTACNLKDRKEFAMLSIRGNLDADSQNRDRSMFYSVDKCGFVPHAPQKQWSVCAARDPESPREMPDVETPRRSPLPEERGLADSEAEEEGLDDRELRQLDELASKVEEAKTKPFKGFTKPPCYMEHRKTKRRLDEVEFDPFAQPQSLEKPLGTSEIAHYSYVLMKAIGDNREAKEALVKLMAYRGQLGFETGRSEGIRVQFAQLARQAAEDNNRDSPP